jgi:hypothetical protein
VEKDDEATCCHSALTIALVAFAPGRLFARMLTLIRSERFSNVCRFLELAVFVPTDVSFVISCIDQFALAHWGLPLVDAGNNSRRPEKVHRISGLFDCDKEASESANPLMQIHFSPLELLTTDSLESPKLSWRKE